MRCVQWQDSDGRVLGVLILLQSSAKQLTFLLAGPFSAVQLLPADTYPKPQRVCLPGHTHKVMGGPCMPPYD